MVFVPSVVPVAQGIARWTSNPEAVGSNPTRDDRLFFHLFFSIKFIIVCFPANVYGCVLMYKLFG